MQREYAPTDRSEAAMLHREYLRQVARVASALRSAAEYVQSAGDATWRQHDGRHDYISAATNAMHEISNMLGNLPSDSMVRAAGDAVTLLSAPLAVDTAQPIR